MLGVDRAGHDMVSQGWCETSDSGTGRTMLANVVHWGREQRLGVNSSGAGMLTSGWELLVGSRWCPSRVFSGGITHASKQASATKRWSPSPLNSVSPSAQVDVNSLSSVRVSIHSVPSASLSTHYTTSTCRPLCPLRLCQMSTSEQRSFFPHSSPRKKRLADEQSKRSLCITAACIGVGVWHGCSRFLCNRSS
jgi:hypothetical protein